MAVKENHSGINDLRPSNTAAATEETKRVSASNAAEDDDSLPAETQTEETLAAETEITEPSETDEMTQTSEQLSTTESDMPVCTAEDLIVFFETDYAHLSTDNARIGNEEGVTITVSAPVTGMTYDDLFIYYEEDMIKLSCKEPREENGKTVFELYATGKKPGTSSITIGTVYELSVYGETASAITVNVTKLDSSEGRIVYVTPTGEKYHFSEECAGENAIKTTYSDVDGLYDPCGKCAG